MYRKSYLIWSPVTVETPSDNCLMLCYNICFICITFVCRDALFPPKSMDPPPPFTLPLSPGFPPFSLYVCDPLLFFFFFFSNYFILSPRSSVCACPLYVGCVILDPPTGHRTARLFFVVGSSSLIIFLSSCLPPRLLVTSLCWSISWTYHGTDRTPKQQPCPRNSACALSACSLRFSCFHHFLV